jgi:hypothetical protein
MLIGFALDPVIFFGGWAVDPLPEAFLRDALFYWGDIVTVVACADLWWVTGKTYSHEKAGTAWNP